MADHFYSIAEVGQGFERKRTNMVVDTTTQTSSIEVRITDGAISNEQAYVFLEWLADLIATKDVKIVAGTLL